MELLLYATFATLSAAFGFAAFAQVKALFHFFRYCAATPGQGGLFMKWEAVFAIMAMAIMGSLFALEGRAQANPIVGTWSWTRAANKCTEVYDYRADGTFEVASGAEKASGRYEIAPTPDGKGFFMLKHRMQETNGGRDCSDAGVQPGDYDKPYSIYVIFHPAAPIHLMCAKASLAQCLGPLRRVTH
jgi:hypothetical protein